MEQRRPWPAAAPFAIAALGLGAMAALWTTGPALSEETWAPPFLRGYAIAWVCYLLAAALVTRATTSGQARLPRWVLVWIVFAAIGMRLVALACVPLLSTDAYRYLWDGRVANAGINPFSYPPEARELRPLRDENRQATLAWRQISFKQVPTIYPPAAQALFAVVARAHDADIAPFHWIFALCDVGCVLLLIALLRRTNRPAERVIWYAWCPLPITEMTAGAHVDAFALLLFLAALLGSSRGTACCAPTSAIGSGLALAGAVMAKGYAVFALPLFVRRGGWRLATSFAIGCGLLAAPYALAGDPRPAGGKLFEGFRAYLGAWEANASIFSVLDNLLARVTADHFAITRALTSGAVVLVIAALTWRLSGSAAVSPAPGPDPLLRGVFLAFGAQLLLGAPTLPWYAIWALPALCWWSVPALALFSLTVSLQYYGRWLYPGDAAAHRALLWAGYLPVYALLIGQWLLLGRSSGRRTPGGGDSSPVPMDGRMAGASSCPTSQEARGRHRSKRKAV